jgi:phosphoribosylformylglycinamidine synthase
VPAALIGKSGGHNLTLPDGDTISLDTVRATHESFFPAWMNGSAK